MVANQEYLDILKQGVRYWFALKYSTSQYNSTMICLFTENQPESPVSLERG
jgi:hypothetical protein